MTAAVQSLNVHARVRAGRESSEVYRCRLR